MPNQLKRDPTRTTLLRRQFMADMTRRFKKVSKAIQVLVVDDDAFGLEGPAFLQVRQVWRFRSDAQKVKAYRVWLQQQVDAGILSPVGGISGKPWTAPYVESAYKKGGLRAYTDLRASELAKEPSLFAGGRAEFLRTAFSQPEALHKIELLYERAFSELKGVTDVMGQQMSRTLSEGLAQGYGPGKIARELRKNVSNITKTRANVIARTEIIRAHAEGQLDAFERLGVEEVGIMAEWSIAGDDRVCIECGELEGVVMTVKEARGLLPRHPNCRCSWIPAQKSRKEKGQMWGKEKDRAIERSIAAEAPKTIRRTAAQVRRRSVWAGKELVVRKAVSKPKPIPKKVVPKKVVGKGELDMDRVFVKGSKEFKSVKKEILAAYKECGIEPGAGAGYCDQVSVTLWDKLGRPENLKPYRVWKGYADHVVLYSRKQKFIIDATGNQFGQPVFTVRAKSPYYDYKPLTKGNMQSARNLVKKKPLDWEPIIWEGKEEVGFSKFH